MSGATVAAIAAIPVVGQVILGIYAADTAGDALQELIDNPAALAVVGGLALLVFLK
jgi:hypothetical protein